MHTLHKIIVTAHITVGALALIIFWLPVIVRKGGRLHRSVGKLFANAMYFVSLTGVAASVLVLANPLAVRFPNMPASAVTDAAATAAANRASATFLLMLSVLVLASVRQGLLALRHKRDPAALRTATHLPLLFALPALAVVTGWLGVRYDQLLFLIFAGIGLLVGVGMLRYTYSEVVPNGAIIEHLRGMLGSGIGAYTAFFAFGGQRFLSELLPGQLQVVPWVLPAIVGSIGIAFYSRRYRRPRSVTKVADVL